MTEEVAGSDRVCVCVREGEREGERENVFESCVCARWLVVSPLTRLNQNANSLFRFQLLFSFFTSCFATAAAAAAAGREGGEGGGGDSGGRLTRFPGD